ncbi:unnamed protein product [Rhizophagus irregularis]|nr:unnamed protein product [Rhizophagus irregularis]
MNFLLTKNWFTSMEIMLLSNQWERLNILNVVGHQAKQNRMKNVATEFAVEGVFIPTSLVFEVVLSFGDVQERIIRHFGISISKIYTFASDELIE